MQGDIIGLYNSNFEQIVTYTYDSWGKVLSVTDNFGNEITDSNHIGLINPFRYRSYYYDEETKLYYLNSRYYNPEWGRFVNVDNYIGTKDKIITYNLYSYCDNNPVNSKDYNGEFAIVIPFIVEAIKDVIALTVALIAMYAVSVVIENVDFQKTTKKEEQKEKHQEYFPENPMDFKPKMLKLVYHEGTKNGAIIERVTPITNYRVFEWDENILYSGGPHYHVIMIEWNKKHLDKIHYKPGDPVPEPWNSQYFGGE